jgi:hypothetical protein
MISTIRQPGCLYEKDVDSTEPYGFDWTAWLVEIGSSELIMTSAWLLNPNTDLVLSSPSIVTGSQKTQVTFAGGTAGVQYEVTNRITTSSGFTDDRSFYILGVER